MYIRHARPFYCNENMQPHQYSLIFTAKIELFYGTCLYRKVTLIFAHLFIENTPREHLQNVSIPSGLKNWLTNWFYFDILIMPHVLFKYESDFMNNSFFFLLVASEHCINFFYENNNNFARGWGRRTHTFCKDNCA